MGLEPLEARHLLTGLPVISEFMASNSGGLLDEDGESSDWIEIFNSGTSPINMEGYELADSANNWGFPPVELESGGYLTVFASNKDRVDPESELHTNFRLSAGGEYLAMVAPDGTVVQEFAPEYPPQVTDVSYGLGTNSVITNLLDVGATGSALVPADGVVANDWQLPSFDDADWTGVTTAIGYETGDSEVALYGNYVDGLSPVAHWTFDSSARFVAVDSSPNKINGLSLTSAREDSPIGRAVDLTKTTDDVRMNASTANFGKLRSTDELAIAAWVQKTGTNVGDVVSLGDHYRVRLNTDGSVEFAFDNSGGADSWISVATDPGIASESVAVDGQWHHIVAQKTSAGLEIWIDGSKSSATLATAESIDYTGLGSDMLIGRNGNTATQNFVGKVDDVAIWDRALTEATVVSLFGGGDTPGGYTETIRSDVQADMFNNNASVYLRLPFEVTDFSVMNQLTLYVQYDDGFVAYLNGTEVARGNAPGDVGMPVEFNAAAFDSRPDAQAVEFSRIDVSDGLGALQLGENILAVHGLNVAPDNPDFLLSARLDAALVTLSTNAQGYMTNPTPGALNNTVSDNLGPVIANVAHSGQPAGGGSIVVTAEVRPTIDPVDTVRLNYRVMFADEIPLTMVDDGTGSDAVAGDGIFTATIPGGVANPGEMIRWFVGATDSKGETSREPRFVDPALLNRQEQGPEYFGTMVADPTVDSDLAVLHWFVENESAAGTDGGTNASLWYNGEFYDNVENHRRGGSTAGTAKTNFKFDFKGTTFRFDPNFGRVEEFNLNSTYSDKAYVRQSMAFEAHDVLGAPGSESFPMHVERNGEFYGVFAFIEEPDAEMLEREGLDPDGALYKFYNEFTSANGARKKTRQYEGNSDLATFISDINGLRNGPQEDMTNYLFDNINVPLTLNYLVATIITHQNDNPHKNHFLYRDSNGTGEWMYIPWDHDLTWGSNWVGTSYSDVIYADVDRITFGPVPGHDPNFIAPSHPFVNTEPYREWNNHWNRLMDAVLTEPRIREMFLRRLRTAMDDFLGSPDVDPDTTYFNQRFDYYSSILSEEGAADQVRWPFNYGDRTQTAAEAIQIIKDDYLAVRRTHLYETHNIDSVDDGQPELLLDELSEGVRYFVPSDNSLALSWTDVAEPANIADWQTGQGGFGYEDAPGDYDDLVLTNVRPADTCAECTSIYVRMPFEVSNVDEVSALTMKLRFDDGFVAYLNGTEVGKALLSGPPRYDVTTVIGIAHSANEYSTYDLSAHFDLLNEGTNMLAIHSFNSSSTDSDQLIAAQLFNGDFEISDVAGIPNEQPPAATLMFGEYDANPASGNQDEEYIRIDNPMDVAIDLTGWRIEGGVDHEFLPGTVIEAGGSLYVAPNVPAFRARATGPSGGQGLFVQGSYRGHMSSFGDEVNLLNRERSVVASLTVPTMTSLNQEYLRVTEVNYNPGAFGAEFIELTNMSDAEMLNLGGVTFSAGFAQPFVFAAGTVLPPASSMVLVQNAAEFQAMYASDEPAQIGGEYVGSLNNAGERIKLDDADGSTIMDFSYSDNAMWPQAADGAGASLVLIDPLNAVAGLEDKAYNWRSSTMNGGTPGEPGVEAPAVVIHKVLSNTDTELSSDTIVLHNTGDSAMGIGGWSLSDSPTPKYTIADGTMIAAGGFLTFDETDFNPTPETPLLSHFALNGAHGDDVWLLIPTGDGSRGGVERFIDDVHFGSAVSEEWFGRDAQGTLAPDMASFSDDFSPRVGPLIISEVNYHPGFPTAAAQLIDQHVSGADLEFVEILNPTGSPVDLTNWRLRGGIDETFADGTMIGAGEAIVVLSFNPEAAGNSNRLAAFKTHYGLGEDVRLVGGYGGQLSDGGDFIRLQRPDTPPVDEPEFVPHTVEDLVFFDDRDPWAEAADGGGQALTRVSATSYGNAVSSWIAAAPSPGSVDFSNVPGDFTGDGLVMADDIDALFLAINAGQTDSIYDLDGSSVVDSTDATFLVENIIGTYMGDATLDGKVDATDLNAVGLNWLVGGTGWASGDFTGDRQTTAPDLNVLGVNWLLGTVPAAAARVPRAALAIRAEVVETAVIQMTQDSGETHSEFNETRSASGHDRLAPRPLKWNAADRYRRVSGLHSDDGLSESRRDEIQQLDDLFARRWSVTY